VVLDWYDARNDASRRRVATYFAVSIDGGQTFAPQTYLNVQNHSLEVTGVYTPGTAIDAVTGRPVDLGPIPDNMSSTAGNNHDTRFGFGTHQGLAVVNGRIYAAWAGNFNGGVIDGKQKTDILGATAVYAAGPRIISSTMGPVSAPLNNTLAPDGTRLADTFEVTFDRPVDPGTFTAAQVKVMFRDTVTPASQPGVALDVVSVTPLDEGTFGPAQARGATRFRIKFDPAKAFAARGTYTGTYSYSVGPGVSDRIRGTDLVVVPKGTQSFTAPANQVNLRIPPVGTGGTGDPTKDTTLSKINVAGVPAGQVVTNVKVTLSLTHTFDSDLVISLIAPDGTTVILSNRNGFSGHDYTNTTFDDAAPQLISLGLPPFTGPFRPNQPLSRMLGRLPNGDWTLSITDVAALDIGNLVSWSLTLETGTIDNRGKLGNKMDQNANGTAGEDPGDIYAAPRPVSGGVPFQGPYAQDTLPLIVPGPHVVSSQVTGNPTTLDNLVLNKTVSSIDVVFDRDMNPASFTPDAVLRIIGPAGLITQSAQILSIKQVNGTATVTTATPHAFKQGDLVVIRGADQANYNGVFAVTPTGPTTFTYTVPTNTAATASGTIAARTSLTVTPNPPGTDPALAKRTFRIGFPTQDLSGTYTLTLSPSIRAASGLNGGDLLDTNQNAGVDVLRGVDPNGAAAGATFNTTAAPVAIKPGSAAKPVTTDISITVPDSFVIQGTTVRLDITYPNDPDLDAALLLISPSGQVLKQVRLFSGVGNTGTRANFSNTVFDDFATTPIANGGPPFFGRFNPQEPLNRFNNSKTTDGTWVLRITNRGANGGTINAFSLTFQKPAPGTGLGEPVADQATVSFRIFTMDPANPLSHNEWTAVGPASIGGGSGVHGAGGGSGRIGGLALDPSDPSGNTVFVAGASGGIWKTTNFLTTNPQGPTYYPLTDFGPTFAINIGGIAVFGRNNDPNQSIVFAATGEGDSPTQGVGFLRSMDGGATWTLLDSTDNTLPLAQRDHALVGTTSFKVLVDPKPTASGEVIVYAALSTLTAGSKGGIWRSVDTGKHWQRVLTGNATDIVFDPNSGYFDAISNPTGNLTVLYAGVAGQGVFVSSNEGQAWSPVPGGVGNPLIQDGDLGTPTPPVPVGRPSDTPNGAKGRIVLAKPFLTGNPDQDLIYQGWLYVVTVAADGHLNGLYLTKDFGQNWTKIHIGNVPGPNQFSIRATPTNDQQRPDYDPLGAGLATQGNYDVSLAIDPTNPNVVYVGGTHDFQPSGLIRVDTTGVSDPHAFYLSGSRNDGGPLDINIADPVGIKDKMRPLFFNSFFSNNAPANPFFSPYINLIHDPASPFKTDATVFINNTSQFANSGAGARWKPFDDAVGGTDQHRLISFKDPLTGHARLIFGDDQGVWTSVDNGDGTLSQGVGTAPFASGSRNGNLQITQFYYGAAQPSTNVAGQAKLVTHLLYGSAQDDGFPQSDPDVLSTGQISWNGPGGDGGGIATDQLGSGTLYVYKWPCCGGGGTNFFQVSDSGEAANPPAIGRTFGLLQQSNPGITPDPQWPFGGPLNFAVNPVNPNQIIISSAAGRIFETANQGKNWFVIADPTGTPPALDGKISLAMAFGAPQPGDPVGALNNFIYVGTNAAGANPGRIFVTFTGGGSNGNGWTDISAGLDGSSVRSIITNPTRGSHEAYAVTSQGVYHMVDSTAKGAKWDNITGNLFQLTHNLLTPFQDSNQFVDTQLRSLNVIRADWRYALPDNPADFANTNAPTHPILYVGGQGGVYRSTDNGKTWALFPNVAADGSRQDGGFLPNAEVTDLSLSLGNIDPTTGRPLFVDPVTGNSAPQVLTAWTYGRGAFAIRLAPDVVVSSLLLDPALPVLPNSKGSDFTTPPGATPKVTKVLQPVFDGISIPSAFGNKIKVEMFERLPDGTLVLVGVDLNNPAQAFTFTDEQGRFRLQLKAGYFKADGTTDGPHTFIFRASDAAGVVGSQVPFVVVLNTQPHIVDLGPNGNYFSQTLPLPNQFGADDQGGSDSGLDRNDRVTKVIRPYIVGTVDFQAAPVLVQLLEGGKVIGQGMTDANGKFSIQVNDGVYKADGSTDGLHTIQIVAPHGTTPSNTVTFKFTLKTTAPATPPAPNLTPASDTGFSNTDHITANNTPTFTGTAEALTVAQLFANGKLVGTSILITPDPGVSTGTYTVTATTPLADGTYDITVRLEDVAGNFSGFSPAMRPPLVIRTTPPTKPTLRLDPVSETSPGSNVSAFSPQIFDGTADPETQVVIKDNGVVIDTFTQPKGQNTFQRTLTLSDGFHALTVESTEFAGNVAVSDILNITINRDALDPDRKFIRQTYFTALGRTGSLAEWNLWIPVLAQPNGRSLVANAIERSREGRDHLIKGYYRTYLTREASGGEENAWVNAMLAGATEEDVISGILGSPEYFSHAPSIPGIGGTSSDTTFIRAVYTQLLNRDAGQADINIWTALIPTVGRQAMALAVLKSPEYRSLFVRGLYLNVLRRPTAPAQSEINLWVNSNMDLTAIRIGFETSDEYYFRVTGFKP
jgi:subtilisin-like proprotein convertase family protein